MRVPTWQTLALIGKRKVVNASFVMLLLTPPVIITLEVLNEVVHAAGAHTPTLIAWVLPFLSTQLQHTAFVLPVNLVRAFWASAAVSIGQTVFLAACPAVLREYDDFDEWRHHDAIAMDREVELSNRFGATKEFEVVRALKQEYNNKRADAANTHVAARVIVTILYGIGGWLTLHVLLNQLVRAARGVPLREIFF